MKYFSSYFKSLLLAVFIMFASFSVSTYAATPKLILQITVDQLRADLPTKYMKNMGEGGFKFLFKQGVVYKNTHHLHANTETIVGHTTLATGANPAIHGMIGNVWFDRNADRLVYNVEDSNYPLLDKNADVNKQTEIDPTQKKARSSGRSPVNINVSTFSDELIALTDGHAKVYSVSVKDRSAISMAGHKGKAFWFSKKTGDFITSRYYYEQLPNWVKQWNEQDIPSQFSGKTWHLSVEQSKYLLAGKDKQTGEVNFPGFGDTFPHQYGKSSGKYFNTFLTLSPVGDELTVNFAKKLIEEEGLGQDAITDYLSVSLSSTDYVGHMFGSSSLEMEDNLLRLDKSLAELIGYVKENIGLDNTLIVLSADHGGADTVAANRAKGLDANHVKLPSWDQLLAGSVLLKEFSNLSSLIKSFNPPYIYLDKALIEKSNVEQQWVEQEIAKAMEKHEAVMLAMPSHRILLGQYPKNFLYQSVANNFNPQRSGDVYLVFKPNYFINEMDGLTVAAHHGSPWRYDTHVPLIFAGNGLTPLSVNQLTATLDVAPTLASYIGAKMPSGNQGQVLKEIFQTSK